MYGDKTGLYKHREWRGGARNDAWHHTIAHKETVWGGVFYPWSDKFAHIPMEMIPYFITCHVNSHTVLNYIDAVQSIRLPGDPCPMCQAGAGLFVLDDMPDCALFVVTTNEIRELWQFVEKQTGAFNWELLRERLESQNELQRFEQEKWDVDARTPYYPINTVAQALYRVYQTQYGDHPIWHLTDRKVSKIMNRCVEKRIETFPKTRHRVIAWSCAPLYYSHWCTWAYNCSTWRSAASSTTI